MRVAWPVLLCSAAVPAWAQAPPAVQPDNAALLRAIEALNKRIDQLEDRNRKAPSRTAPAPAPAPRAAAAAAPTKTTAPPPQAVHGWFVYLIPWTDAREDVPIGGFPGPAHEFKFDLHSRYVPGQNRFIYYGRSLLHIKEDAEYGFAVDLEPYAGNDPSNGYHTVAFNCSVELLISGNRVLAGATTLKSLTWRTNQDLYRSQLITGRIRLQPPEPGKSYPIDFKVDCWEVNQPKMTYFDGWLPVWKKNRFRILFKAPGDMLPRPFKPDELWYVGQP